MPRLVGGTLSLDPGSVNSDHIDSTTNIDADKLQHIYKSFTNFDLAIGGTPVTREEIVFVASNTARLRAFSCTLNDTGTSTSITFDIKKNGTTMLTGTVSFTHSDTDKQIKDGTISGAGTITANDIISIAMTVSSATGAQGPFAWAEIEEAPPP